MFSNALAAEIVPCVGTVSAALHLMSIIKIKKAADVRKHYGSFPDALLSCQVLDADQLKTVQQKAVEAMSVGGIISETGGYELRFRILELWNELMERL